jgi:hypothetical protein
VAVPDHEPAGPPSRPDDGPGASEPDLGRWFPPLTGPPPAAGADGTAPSEPAGGSAAAMRTSPGPPPGVPQSAGDAVAMALAGLSWLAGADVASLPADVQAGCLRGLEQVLAVHTAARARMLGSFTAQRGYEGDGVRHEAPVLTGPG